VSSAVRSGAADAAAVANLGPIVDVVAMVISRSARNVAAGLVLSLGIQLLATPAIAQDSPAGRSPRVVFNCRSFSTNLGGSSGALTLEKSFYEDGSVSAQFVRWEDYSGSFMRRHDPNDRTMATLNWSGVFGSGDRRGGFDWSMGTIKLIVLNNSIFRPNKKERWHQFLIDRNGTARVYREKSDRYVQIGSVDLLLRSDLGPPSSSGLEMSLDSLMAWSTGAKSITVYETFVTPRRYRSNEYPTSPAGAMRIVAEYDIDSPALAAKVAQIRTAADKWMDQIGDFKSKCTQGREETGNDIIIT